MVARPRVVLGFAGRSRPWPTTTTRADPLTTLRRRSSEKWRTHPADVLPMFVAEMDFGLAPAIKAVLPRAHLHALPVGLRRGARARARRHVGKQGLQPGRAQVRVLRRHLRAHGRADRRAARRGDVPHRPALDATVAAIEANLDLLDAQLAEHLPGVRLRRPDASSLAWLDLSALGWGDDPAAHALQAAKVALSSGPTFGPQGSGHARMNLACAPETIVEAVARLARAAG